MQAIVSDDHWMPRHPARGWPMPRHPKSPHHEISFFLSSLTPNLSYITHTHEPSKYQGKMSTYSVNYKGLTWRTGHLSAHYKGLRIVMLLDDL